MIERSENELQFYGAQGAVHALKALALEVIEGSDELGDPASVHVAAEFVRFIMDAIPAYEQVIVERGRLVHEELEHESHDN